MAVANTASRGLDPYKKYAVYEELRDTWIEVIFKHEGLVFTSSGQELSTGTSFLNAKLGSICGMKWEDIDLSKTVKLTDIGVSGWTINLYVKSDGDWKLIACMDTDSEREVLLHRT